MKNFELGRLMMTKTISNTMDSSQKFAKEITKIISRYIFADWGDMCQEDKELNDKSVNTGVDRILAAYKTSKGKVYVITEADRSYTTILFAEEY